MRRGFSVAVCGFLLLAGCQTQAPKEQSLPTHNSIDNLVTYQFVSAKAGWAHVFAGGDVIAKTEDGGRTWRQQLRVDGLKRTPTMQWIDARHGVLIGEMGDRALLFRSDDAGTTWRSLAIPQPQVPPPTPRGKWVSVTGHFVDPSHGWAFFRNEPCALVVAFGCPLGLGYSWLPYQTSDGGLHWTELGMLPALPQRDFSITFAGLSAALVTTRQDQQGIVSTQNGFATSSLAEVPSADLGCPRWGCRLVTKTAALFSANDGVMVLSVLELNAWTSGGACAAKWCTVARSEFRTYDGGRTWIRGTDLPTGFNLVLFTDLNHAINIDPRFVQRSEDGGATWSTVGSISVPEAWLISDAQFVDSKHGWVAITTDADKAALNDPISPASYSVLGTSDGGRTWQVLRLPTLDPGSNAPPGAY